MPFLKSTTMSKARLQHKIEVANRRYFNGLNDDDQVKSMIEEAFATKGWHVLPDGNEYVMISDEEMARRTANKYGYWSDQMEEVNGWLVRKGGHSYMAQINNKIKQEQKQSK